MFSSQTSCGISAIFMNQKRVYSTNILWEVAFVSYFTFISFYLVLATMVNISNTQVISMQTQVNDQLTHILQRILNLDHSPRFTHYLFEAFGLFLLFHYWLLLLFLIAALIRTCCKDNPSSSDQFLRQLVQPFTVILSTTEKNSSELKYSEFVPYVIQIFTLLTHFSTNISEPIANLIRLFLNPDMWEYGAFITSSTAFFAKCIKKVSFISLLLFILFPSFSSFL